MRLLTCFTSVKKKIGSGRHVGQLIDEFMQRITGIFLTNQIKANNEVRFRITSWIEKG